MTRTRHDDVDDVLRVIVRCQRRDPRVEAAPIGTLYAAVERTLDALDTIGRLRPAGAPDSYHVVEYDGPGVVAVAGAQVEHATDDALRFTTPTVEAVEALLDFVEHSMTTGTPPHDLARKADDALRRLRPSIPIVDHAGPAGVEALVEAIGTLPTDGLDLGALGDAYDTIEVVCRGAMGTGDEAHYRAVRLLDAVRQAREEQDTAGLTVEAAVTDAMDIEHADPDTVVDAVIVDEAAYNALDTVLALAEMARNTHTVGPHEAEALDTVRRHRDRLTRHVEDASPQREAPGLRAPDLSNPGLDVFWLNRLADALTAWDEDRDENDRGRLPIPLADLDAVVVPMLRRLGSIEHHPGEMTTIPVARADVAYCVEVLHSFRGRLGHKAQRVRTRLDALLTAT